MLQPAPPLYLPCQPRAWKQGTRNAAAPPIPLPFTQPNRDMHARPVVHLPQTRVLEPSPRRLGHICLQMQADNRTSHDMGRPAAGASPTLAARVQYSTERDEGDRRAGSRAHNRARTYVSGEETWGCYRGILGVASLAV
jgi:hypothetical protein